MTFSLGILPLEATIAQQHGAGWPPARSGSAFLVVGGCGVKARVVWTLALCRISNLALLDGMVLAVVAVQLAVVQPAALAAASLTAAALLLLAAPPLAAV